MSELRTERGAQPQAVEVELLDKTEVWVTGVTLHDADLVELGAAAAGVLGLPADRVFVTDVRDGRLTFDVLLSRIRLDHITGRSGALLDAIGRQPGVTLDGTASVHSAGVLGAIATAPEDVEEVLTLATELDTNLRRWVATRVAVVSTGGELLSGEIRDTNLATAQRVLGASGYEVVSGGTVPDEEATIAGRIARLVGDGFGLVVTTGGVGAEDKDRTVEALEVLQPALATSTLATFTPGHGRHVKAEVRVAVASVGWSRVICLPGPTREVEIGLRATLDGLADGLDDATLADRIGEAIRTANRTQHRSC